MTHKIIGRRDGMTLIEIMIAILILSIGLLGVLAAVPFGAMQMNKMVEKDFVTNTAKNAHQILATNGWLQPTDWAQSKGVNEPNQTVRNVYLSRNFTYPVLLDPIGYTEFPFSYANEIPSYNIPIGTESIDIVYPECPKKIIDNAASDPQQGTIEYNVNKYYDQLDPLFRSTDDIIYDREDNSTNRPILLKENETDSNSKAAYTGEYSWMAMISPIGDGEVNSYDNITFPIADNDPTAVVNVQADVIVFRGRVPGDANDYLTADAVVNDGYAGGVVTLTTTAIDDLQENLESSTHLLLAESNPDDQAFTAWYKIANIGKPDSNSIQVTLIGATWKRDENNNNVPATAIVFKNVRGVLTETTRLTGK